ncbi:PhzF family phenazine biosynthesis protein [Deinococcus pimensis]|uniref:PhzF family phenazine biosynthesis protein n=1 Tax=Deinococcus pimensis TaxID=309888 RepID=UPI000483A406|nr:PhzF family phenazine biosynthesis protein [Deinococcus pimensis]
MSKHNVEVSIVKAFTSGDVGGNPAGVVLDADDLSSADKQAVAARVGLPETAFVSKSDVADFKLEFFTPVRQIAHCGHATIATFSLLVQRGRLSSRSSSKETIDGTRRIVLDGEQVFMEQAAPKYTSLRRTSVAEEEVLASLGLEPSQLIRGHRPVVVNTGNSFLLVPVETDATLASVTPDFAAIERISDALDLIGYYAFTRDVRSPVHDVAARMFAPRYGILEEAATGMAAGPLAAYLYDIMNVKQDVLLVAQGLHMAAPSPSTLEVRVEARDGQVVGLMAGGYAQEAEVRSVELPVPTA